MYKITLKDFVAKHGQRGAGELIGVNQSAVGQMLNNKRDIYIFERDDGQIETWERKPIGRTRFKT